MAALWTDEMVEQMMEMDRAGLSRTIMASRLGLTTRQLYSKLYKHGNYYPSPRNDRNFGLELRAQRLAAEAKRTTSRSRPATVVILRDGGG